MATGKMKWARVVEYDPITQTCTLAPASNSQAGVIYGVPIAWWGGSWQGQKRASAKLTQAVEPGRWGDSAQGPRWGVTYPVQQGDLARVDYIEGDQSNPVITAFVQGITGTQGAAFVGTEQGESPYDRFDLLLPSGAWARSLQDGSWIISTGPVGGPAASVVIGADGTITLNGAALVVNCPEVTVNGVTTFTESGQNVKGKEIMVIGGKDTDNDSMVSSGQ